MDTEDKIKEQVNTEAKSEAKPETGTEPAALRQKSDTEFSQGTKQRIFFFLGVLCCLVVCGLFYKFQTIGKFVPQDEFDYFIELNDNYGKYNTILKYIGEDPLAENTPGEIDDAKLKELVASIGDPYAEYYTVDEYKEFEKQYMGDYVGIGVSVTTVDDKVLIVDVFKDGPAGEAGIKPGDVLIDVDGTKPKDSNEAVELLSGDSGTPVKVTVLREEENLSFDLNRTKIEVKSVEYNELKEDNGIGYIRISSFIKNTAKDFKLAVRDLKNKGCDRFIIDLRNNGGGLTDESIAIADYLLPACKIMSEESKNGNEKVYNSKESSADIKYVVLTNGNTASASEILSGAIQDNKGGLIIGSRTYGKGVTQATHKFNDGTAVKLTVTEYFRPNGKTVNEEGITPDIKASDEEAMDVAIRELNK